MVTELRGKVVLVTGGAKNLGRAIACRLGADGARIVVHHHSAAAARLAGGTVQEITASGGDAFSIQADLRHPAEVERVFTETLDTFGSLYATVHTAGELLSRPMAQTTVEQLDQVFAVNAKTAYLVMQGAARHTDPGGVIASVLSSLLVIPAAGYSAFTGAKAAIEQFSRVLAKELAGQRVTVCSVAPGLMDTDFLWSAVHGAEAQALRGMAEHGGFTAATDIAEWVAHILRCPHPVNGQTVFLNGGQGTR